MYIMPENINKTLNFVLKKLFVVQRFNKIVCTVAIMYNNFHNYTILIMSKWILKEHIFILSDFGKI